MVKKLNKPDKPIKELKCTYVYLHFDSIKLSEFGDFCRQSYSSENDGLIKSGHYPVYDDLLEIILIEEHSHEYSSFKLKCTFQETDIAFNERLKQYKENLDKYNKWYETYGSILEKQEREKLLKQKKKIEQQLAKLEKN